ncbi:hypothetical protein ACFO9Q_10195 [Paenibacillus sp. GCM10023252]|uniref:hypothetical protein n=1 Tax=Paenibacillus sp. GCM10023252 TaxID=3252649 RepID=UPI00361B03E9
MNTTTLCERLARSEGYKNTMEITLDISDDFDKFIDFSESCLYFDAAFDSMTSFKAWGITILKEAKCFSSFKQFEGKDLYISGFALVEVGEIHQGNLSIALYKRIKEGFIYDVNNKIVNISTSWKATGKEENLNKEYNFQCVSYWPYGYCELRLVSNDPITIKIETDNIIDTASYVLNTKKYGFARLFEEGKSFT